MFRFIVLFVIIAGVYGIDGSKPKTIVNPEQKQQTNLEGIIEQKDTTPSKIQANSPKNVTDEVASREQGVPQVKVESSSPELIVSDNPEEYANAVNLLDMFRVSLESQIEPVSTPTENTQSKVDNTNAQPTQQGTANAEPQQSTLPNPPPEVKPPPLTPAPVPPPSLAPVESNVTDTDVPEEVAPAIPEKSSTSQEIEDGGAVQVQQAAPVLNLEMLLSSGNMSATAGAGAPIAVRNTEEDTKPLEDPLEAEIISGMPIRELQLLGNVSDILSEIALEIDELDKSATQDEFYGTNYEFSVDPLLMNYECNIIEGNLEGIIMMRDYNSMYFQGLGVGVKVESADGCCEACKRTQGCNGWTYCDNPTGCGYGCEQVLKENKRATLEDFLPVEGFGQFSGCGNNDRFPYRMCTLKSVDDWHDPVVANGSETEGYVSGFLEDPALVCGWNMSLRVCNQCVNSKDPYACTWCGNWEHLGPDEKEYCSVCTESERADQTSQCLGCLGYYGTQRACGSCVRSSHVGECLSCAALNMDDENHQRWCYECSKSGNNMEECMECIQDPNLSYPYKQLCKMCIRDDIGSPSNCMQCLRSAWDINHAQLCPKCAALDNFDDTICFNCLSSVLDPNIRHACLECSTQASPFYCQMCLQNEAIPYYAKDQCPKCTGESNNPENCMKCLESSTPDSSIECTKCIKSSNETLCNSCVQNVQDESLKNLCFQCTESSNPGKCMSCLYDSTVPQHAKKYCANCMQSDSNGFNNACMKCLRRSESDTEASGCSTCTETYNKNATCFDCVQNYAQSKKSQRLMAQCSVCYGTWATQSCLNCMENAKTQHQINLCRKCAFSSRSSTCYECLDDLKGDDDGMETCLNCLESSNFKLCSQCIKKQDNLFIKQICQFCLNTDDPEGCVNCLDNPQVPEFAKYHCYLCRQNSVEGGVGSEVCEDCLKALSPDEGYFCWNCCQQCGQQPICPNYMTFSSQSGVIPNPDYLSYDYE